MDRISTAFAQTVNHSSINSIASKILFPHKISVSKLTNQCVNNAIKYKNSFTSF